MTKKLRVPTRFLESVMASDRRLKRYYDEINRRFFQDELPRNVIVRWAREGEEKDVACTEKANPDSKHSYLILLNREKNPTPSIMLSSLAHEMVHIKQFATGELVDNPSGKTVKWMGKRVSVRDDDGYWTLPWEIEAYGRQPGLYARFCRHKGI